MRTKLVLLLALAASGCSQSLERFPVVSVTTLTRSDSGNLSFAGGHGVLVAPNRLLLTGHQVESPSSELSVNGEKIPSWQLIDGSDPDANADWALLNLDHCPKSAQVDRCIEIDESSVKPGEILHTIYVNEGGTLEATSDRVVKLTETSSPRWREFLMLTNTRNLSYGKSGSGVFRSIRPGARPVLLGVLTEVVVTKDGNSYQLVARPKLQRYCRR